MRRDGVLLPRGLSLCGAAEPVAGLGNTLEPASFTKLPVTTVRINVVTPFSPSFLSLPFFSLIKFIANLLGTGNPLLLELQQYFLVICSWKVSRNYSKEWHKCFLNFIFLKWFVH